MLEQKVFKASEVLFMDEKKTYLETLNMLLKRNAELQRIKFDNTELELRMLRAHLEANTIMTINALKLFEPKEEVSVNGTS